MNEQAGGIDAGAYGFTLGGDQLRMLDASLHWTVEPGVFDVMIGASSADIRLAGVFHVA
ncbi:MAG: hypothetical protein KGY99_10445 [Phycisphaerae bacterium]|nr:hypothetical protein [Phycisphaerae bacterium]